MQTGFLTNPCQGSAHSVRSRPAFGLQIGVGTRLHRHIVAAASPRGSGWAGFQGGSGYAAFSRGGTAPGSSSSSSSSSSSGGSGGGAGGGSSGGGSGGGGGSPGDEGEQKGGFRWKGWEARVAADPQFRFKVFCEMVIGLMATVLGDMSSRPNWGLHELDFVFATLVVGAIINFSAVWLLAPTAGAGGAARASALQTLLSEKYLLGWGAPGGHMFERGFPLPKRLLNWGYKGAVFALIGMGAGVVGTTVSNGLIALRKRLDPGWSTPNVPPGVLGNAACWAAHMGISANTRYQMINGLDMLLQPLMPSPLFRAYSFLLRSANNVLGGISFVMAARMLGVQNAPVEAATPVGDAAVAKDKQ